MGFAGKAGVTGDIDFITKKDLIGILRHLKEDESALQECKKTLLGLNFSTRFI